MINPLEKRYHSYNTVMLRKRGSKKRMENRVWMMATVVAVLILVEILLTAFGG